MMPNVIENRQLINDDWQTLTLAEGEDAATLTLPAEGKLIVPLGLWQARKAELSARQAPLGLLLDTHAPLEEIAADLPAFALIAIRFEKFADGRGYSLASLLRQRYGFGGKLRATGDFLHDQLFYLERVGFDSFALPENLNAAYALEKGFTTFSDSYQAASTEAQPWFRRQSA